MNGKLSQRLLKSGLPAVFLAVWAAVVWLLARTVEYLRPAMSGGDPAGLAVGLVMLPWLLYLAQSLFYLPRRASGRPTLIGECLFNAPLVFLPFPSGANIETGPALAALTTAEERAESLAMAEARLRSFNVLARLTRLLEARSPLDIILTRLSGRSPLVAWPARLIYLVMGPARQFTRLWGFIFFRAWRAWDDPGPEDEATAWKRDLAFDLASRLPEARSGEPVEEAVGLQRLLAALRRVYNNPAYGGRVEAPADEVSKSLYDKPYLDPGYYGLYLDIPVTLAADTPAALYDGGPEEDPAIFYPPELGPEVERAALLKARLDRWLNVLAQWPEDGLIRIDGRLRPAWRLRAEALDIQAELDHLHKRLAAHHRRCRSSHLAAAVKQGRGWPEALRGLAGLIFFAEHERQALTVAVDGFLNDSSLKTPSPNQADTSDEDGDERLDPDLFLYSAIYGLRERLSQLELPAELEVRKVFLSVDELPPPGELNHDSWSARWEPLTAKLFKTLETLREQALTFLLALEKDLEAEHVSDQPPLAAFEAPGDCSTLRPAPPVREHSRSDAERLRAGFGRSAAALLVMTLLIWQGQTVGHSRVTIYNGLGREVVVAVDGRSLRLAPFGHDSIKLWPARVYEITATIDGRPLESFQQRLAPGLASEVYNIAGAAPLMEWWSPRSANEEGHFLGRPRWLLTRAEILFLNPPPSDKTRKLVLSGYGDSSPAEMLSSFDSPLVRDELIRLHAAWDDPNTPWFFDWQALLFDKPYAVPILLERLRETDYLEHRIDALAPADRQIKNAR